MGLGRRCFELWFRKILIACLGRLLWMYKPPTCSKFMLRILWMSRRVYITMESLSTPCLGWQEPRESLNGRHSSSFATTDTDDILWCSGIPPGGQFEYVVPINSSGQSGTYWVHAHTNVRLLWNVSINSGSYDKRLAGTLHWWTTSTSYHTSPKRDFLLRRRIYCCYQWLVSWGTFSARERFHQSLEP